jgi:hypothetical protein
MRSWNGFYRAETKKEFEIGQTETEGSRGGWAGRWLRFAEKLKQSEAESRWCKSVRRKGSQSCNRLTELSSFWDLIAQRLM